MSVRGLIRANQAALEAIPVNEMPSGEAVSILFSCRQTLRGYFHTVEIAPDDAFSICFNGTVLKGVADGLRAEARRPGKTALDLRAYERAAENCPQPVPGRHYDMLLDWQR